MQPNIAPITPAHQPLAAPVQQYLSGTSCTHYTCVISGCPIKTRAAETRITLIQ